jgi:prevent-host-death family protein
MAEQIGIREFKNRATEIIRQVRAGREYIITVNGQPAAIVKPVEGRPRRTREEIAHDLRVLERIKEFAANSSANGPSVVELLIRAREARDRSVRGWGDD